MADTLYPMQPTSYGLSLVGHSQLSHASYPIQGDGRKEDRIAFQARHEQLISK